MFFAQHIRQLILASVAGACVTTGCGTNHLVNMSSPDEIRETTLPGVLVDSDWLSEHYSDVNVIVVDVRDPDEYAAGHIVGAVNLPSSDLLDLDPANSKDLAPVNLVEKRLSAAGIDTKRCVVVYDGSNYRVAARVFWVLEVHGHPNVAVLDGGIGAWTSKNLPLSTSTPRPSPTQFIANMQPERMATKLTVIRAIQDPGTIILDSRSLEEYRGLLSKAARKGHIKSAVNVDFNRNLVFNEEGVCSFTYSDRLLDLYRSELGDCDRVISYCNSGNRASVSYLALRVIGYNVAVYDGSWFEWGNDPNLPIEQEPKERY